MSGAKLIRILSVVVLFSLVLPSSAYGQTSDIASQRKAARATREPGKVVIEGVVRSAEGTPIPKAYVYLTSGNYSTQGSTTIFPIWNPAVKGVVAYSDPDAVKWHDIHGHKNCRTDKDGHFRFKVDAGYTYTINARDIATFEALKKRVTQHVDIKDIPTTGLGGTTVQQDFVLHE